MLMTATVVCSFNRPKGTHYRISSGANLGRFTIFVLLHFVGETTLPNKKDVAGSPLGGTISVWSVMLAGR